jgi:hypothetical protein
MEVVPLVVPIGTLTRSESVSEMSGLAVAISEVLDISLSEVRAQYFRGSGTSSEVYQMMAEEQYSLREDLQEQERFAENWKRNREAEVRSYRECKGTSIRFLTSPVLSHSTLVHMYSPSPPLYYLQGSYLKPTTSRPECLTTFQKSTHR